MDYYIIINKDDRHLYENKFIFGELLIRENPFIPKGMAFICGESFNSDKMILRWINDKEFEYKKLDELKYDMPLIIEDPYEEHLKLLKNQIFSLYGTPIVRPEFHGLIYTDDNINKDIKKIIDQFNVIGKRNIDI